VFSTRRRKDTPSLSARRTTSKRRLQKRGKVCLPFAQQQQQQQQQNIVLITQFRPDIIDPHSKKTLAAFRKAIAILVNYDRLAKMLFVEEKDLANDMLTQVQDMLNNRLELQGRGPRGEHVIILLLYPDADTNSPAGKVRKGLLANIATQEEVNELLALYQSHFDSIQDAYNVDPATTEQLSEKPQPDDAMNEALGDLGTEEESDKTSQELAASLHFPNQRPIQFNEKKFKYSTLDLWEPENRQITGDMEDVTLVWAQLAGVSAMVRKSFYEKPRTTTAPGILLADTMGMGKSAMVMAFLAFIMQVQFALKENASLPPIVGKSHPVIFYHIQRQERTMPHSRSRRERLLLVYRSRSRREGLLLVYRSRSRRERLLLVYRSPIPSRSRSERSRLLCYPQYDTHTHSAHHLSLWDRESRPTSPLRFCLVVPAFSPLHPLPRARTDNNVPSLTLS
jgi:hypothetical protein